MEIVTDLSQINRILNKLNGSKAQLWLYDITHKRLAIRISINMSDEVAYIVMASCEYIRGNFSWNNPNFSVNKYYNGKRMENIYSLIDNDTDFLLEGSSGIVLAKGVESEFGDSFENFFQEQ
ncbi:hypothetical protein ATE47_11915 [Chryseobacterium sp. IHB B 17019]|uniref:hypothetical protein n=1 Tax=Chryseobacterium sp. IHB B 17019 TaxID=1721091 RepID=UPI000720BACD|nr:hypothetical protein [Chryseobacterium sp. IHB B 17019]ALR31182.1 hypothetical protein ATE47_11915 [Chryseobacterium sp. IHB B 17019]